MRKGLRPGRSPLRGKLKVMSQEIADLVNDR